MSSSLSKLYDMLDPKKKQDPQQNPDNKEREKERNRKRRVKKRRSPN